METGEDYSNSEDIKIKQTQNTAESVTTKMSDSSSQTSAKKSHTTEEPESVFKDDEDFKRVMFPQEHGEDYSDIDNENVETFIISDFEEMIVQS